MAPQSRAVRNDRGCDRHHMQSVMIPAISASILAVRQSSATVVHLSQENRNGSQPACVLEKEKPDMTSVPSAACRKHFSKQVLKQIVWFQQELAKAERSGLDVAESKSIRGAILKSVDELETLVQKVWIDEARYGCTTSAKRTLGALPEH